MFVLFFAIFVFVFTVFENFFVGAVVLGFLLVLITVFYKLKFKKNIKKVGFLKHIGLLIFAFLLVFLALSRKQNEYFSLIPDSFFVLETGSVFVGEKSVPQQKIYAGTGIVSDTYNQNKYVFQDGEDRKFFLVSKKKYQIGEEIFLNGYVQPGKVDVNLLYNQKNQKNQVKNFFKETSWTGLFNYEFDYENRLMMKGFYGTIYEQNSVKISENAQGVIGKLRKNLQNKIVQSYGENRVSGLILGMLIGDKSQIPKQDYQGFIDSGLVHLIAVSGGNIIMIVTFLGFVLFFLPFYLRNFVVLFVVIFYALICGMDSSVFRATIMGSLGLIVLFWGKEINIRRSMAIAFVVMLLINPYFLVYDVGFLLSFGAIIGILYISNGGIEKLRNGNMNENNSINKNSKFRQIIEKIKKTKIGSKFIDFIKSYIQPTIGATIGIFPLIIFFMGKINLISLIGNVLVLPIVPFVMIYGFLSVWIYDFLGRKWILTIEEVLVNYIYRVSEFVDLNGIYFVVNGYGIKYLILIFAVLIFLVYKFFREKN